MTQEELNVLANEFYDYLANQKDFYEVWPSEDDTICVDVDWGDWKHDHLRLDHVAREFFNEKGYDVLDMDTQVTDEDGSDTYSATHSYRLRKHVEESLDEESNGKGEKIAQIIARAYKGRVGPFGGEDPYLDGNKVTFHSQGPNESWIFNDDGSVDSGDDVDYLVAHSDPSDYGYEDGDELRAYFEEIKHFDSVEDLFNSGLSWFMEVPNEKELLRKINNILQESINEEDINQNLNDVSIIKGHHGYDERDDKAPSWEEQLEKAKQYQARELFREGRRNAAKEVREMSLEEFEAEFRDNLGDEGFEDLVKEANSVYSMNEDVESKVRFENPRLVSWKEMYLNDVCGGDEDLYNELYADMYEDDEEFGDSPCQVFYDVVDDEGHYLGKLGVYKFESQAWVYEIGFEPNEKYLNKDKLELQDLDLPFDGWFDDKYFNEDIRSEEEYRKVAEQFLPKIENAIEYSNDNLED